MSFLADDADLALLGDVHIVDVATVVQLGGFHLGILGQQSLDVGVELAVAVDHLHTPLVGHRRDDVDLRHLFAQTLQVTRVQGPHTSFSETVERLGGRLFPDEGGVGGEAFEGVAEHLLHARSTANQGHQHEHTPKHAESSEEGARLVAEQGLQQFVVGIEVYSHIILLSMLLWGGSWQPSRQA